MRNELEGAERLIQELRALISRCGWAGKDPGPVVEGVVSILMRYLATGRPLTQLVDETLALPGFNVPGMDEKLILNTLIFLYDRDLMERSRDLLSHLAADLGAAPAGFLGHVNAILSRSAKDYPPRPQVVDDKPLFGVSLVLAFEYPEKFAQDVQGNFAALPLVPASTDEPPPGAVYRTHQMHFTLLNVGIDLPAEKRDRLVTALQPPLRQLIRTDFAVRRAVQTMRDQARVRPLFRIMRDGSIIQLGSGAQFLSAFCDFRQAVFPVIARLSPASAAYNIWIHTVYARPSRELASGQVGTLIAGARALAATWNGDERTQLENVRFAIMVFEDKKAILPPFAMTTYDLDTDEWIRVH